MDDLISRQDAYKVLTDYYHHKTEIQHIGLKEALNRVPSAQQEIIRCRDCRWHEDQDDSTRWLPCMAILTPDEFYCGYGERRTDEEVNIS